MLFDSPIISRGSGSLAGLTFSHNRGGNYVKARSNPTNPNTPQQQEIRTHMADLSNLWSNLLDAADRGKWDTYASNVPVINRLGASIFLTGLNHYVRSNVPRLQAGLPRVDIAPDIFNLGSFTDVSVTAAAATDSVSIAFTDTDDWANEDDGAMLIYTARPQNPSINYFKGPYQFAGSILGADISPPVSPGGAVSNFPFEVGQKIFGRVQVTDVDGRLSADATFEAIAA